jgi:hypothetical protein
MAVRYASDDTLRVALDELHVIAARLCITGDLGAS